MLARFACGLMGLLFMVGTMLSTAQSWAAPQAQFVAPSMLELSASDNGRGGAIFSIVLRNSGTALTNVSVSAMLPPGASYEDSWIGDSPGVDPGKKTDTAVTWHLASLDANAVVGPFRFRLAAPAGSNLTSQATALWQLPSPGSIASGIATVQVTSSPTTARLEVSVERQSPNTAIVTLVIRNFASFDFGDLSIFGSIPAGAIVLSSWTGEGPDHPGSVNADQAEIVWFNPTVPQGGIQGPFRYQLQFNPESGPSVRARANWLKPEPGQATAAEVRLAEPPPPPPVSPAGETASELALTNGRFYKQTNAAGPQFDAGFAVVDGGQDINGQPITFWSAFQQFGGSPVLGYPISRRFKLAPDDPFVYQLFQKGLLQWNPSERRAVLANLGDLLSNAGLDAALENLGYAPAESDSSGGDFALARQERLIWLDTPGYQDLRDAYLAVPDRETVLGLPAAHPRSYGWIRVLRLQRGALATYNDGPVVWTSLGDDAKKLGFFSGDIVTPQTLAESRVLDAAVRSAPATSAAALPVAYQYREWFTETRPNCSLTMLRGTVKDAQGNGVNSLLIRSWNNEGNEHFALTGYQLQPGEWERFIDYGVKPSLWNIQVVDPNTHAPLSPVSRVRFTDQCGEGGIQEIWVHYRANY